jgi:hypothetical protein
MLIRVIAFILLTSADVIIKSLLKSDDNELSESEVIGLVSYQESGLKMIIQVTIPLAAICEHENSRRPINALPPETLCAIFETLQQTQVAYLRQSCFRQRSWVVVTKVCRYWRSTALAATTLWTTIILRRAQDPNVPLSIQRSLSLPIKLFYFERYSTATNAEALELVAPHCWRLEEFHATYYSSQIWKFFRTPAPALKSLELTEHSGMHSDPLPLPPIFSGETPRLERLSLTGVPSWPNNQFINLIHIALAEQSPQGRHTFPQFLDFLRASPRLQTLKLVDAGPKWHEISPDFCLHGDVARVALDHLCAVEIGFIGEFPQVQHIAAFFSYLAYPNTTTISVWAHPPYYRQSWNNPPVHHLSSFLIHCDILSTVNKITMGSTGLRGQNVTLSDRELIANGDLSPRAPCCFGLLQHCPLDRVMELRLDFRTHHHCDCLEWGQILGRLSNVQNLYLSQSNPKPTLCMLADSAGVAFLKLRTLVIFIPVEHMVALFDLYHFVQISFSAGTGLQKLRIISERRGPWVDAEEYLKRFVPTVEIDPLHTKFLDPEDHN